MRNGTVLTWRHRSLLLLKWDWSFWQYVSKQIIAHVTPHMVLSNHSMVFVYVSLLWSFFASRPYNYSLCGVLGRRTWKTYLEHLYCKVKAWIHGGKQHANMIKCASVWIWVEGWLLKDSLSKSSWLRSWAIFDAHPLFFFCSTLFSLSSLFFHHLFQLSFFQLSLFFSQHIAHVSFSDLYGQWR